MFLCRTTHLCHHHRLRTSILSLWKWSASPARAIHFDLLGHVASPREQRHPLMGHQLCLLDSLVSTCRAVRLTAMTKSSKVYLCIFQRRFSSSLQPCGSIQWLQMERGQVDFTGAMMVLALKLISAGVSYQDGLRKAEVCMHQTSGCKERLKREASSV